MTFPNTVFIAIDPGSSLWKILYTARTGKPQPIALPPEFGVVNGRQIDIYMQSYSDAPLRSTYITVDGVPYAFGEFARSNQIRQYHEFSKWDELGKKILTILG